MRGGVLACMYVRFFNKNAEIFKMKFYSYSPVFPIDYKWQYEILNNLS